MIVARRQILRGLAASAAAAVLPSLPSLAASSGTLTLDARGRIRPASPSPLHLGAARATAHGEESLRATTLYLERALRDPVSGRVSATPQLPISGEFHFARCRPEDWGDGLRKMKACGITLVSTYLFWILHEPDEGTFVWTGRRDLRRFLSLCRALDLEVILRVGPYAHGEFRNGGLPDWLYSKSFSVRSNDPAYLACVRRFFAQVAAQLQGLLWRDGGPILALQLENEFMSASSPWELDRAADEPIVWMTRGSGGAAHMAALKSLALETGLVAPLYTSTGWGCPLPPFECLPLYGGYAFEPWSIDPATHAQRPSWTFLYRDAHPRLEPTGEEKGGAGAGLIPYGHCELGGGMQCFYLDRFVVPADSVQATAITALGSGSSLLGYYVFHGGNNPAGERVSYAEYDVPRIGYGFQAPIREYGQLADSYRALRLLHLFVRTWGSELAAMQTTVPAGSDVLQPTETASVRCALRCSSSSGFLFLTNYQDHVPQPPRRDLRFHLQLDSADQAFPARSALSLAADESAVFPINLVLGRATLVSATAQLITQLVHQRTRHVFLFAPRGVDQPELALSGVTGCLAPGASVQRIGSLSVVRGPASGFRVQCAAPDETLCLHVLARAQALTLSRHRFAGIDRIVLTTADAVERDSGLLLWSEQTEVSARIFPPLPGSPVLADAILPPMTELRASTPAAHPAVTLDRIADDTLRIVVPADALTGLDNLLLRVDYIGDVARLFDRGTLVADHFANGVPWEIGLRQHCEGPTELLLKATPRTAATRVVLDETVPHPERFASASAASIASCTLVPVYRFLLTAQENA